MKKGIAIIMITLSVVSCCLQKNVVLKKTYVSEDKYRKTTLSFINDSIMAVKVEFSCPHLDKYPTHYNVICSYTQRDTLLQESEKPIKCKLLQIKNVGEGDTYNPILWKKKNTTERIGPVYLNEHERLCLFPPIEEEKLIMIGNQIFWVKDIESGSFGLIFDYQKTAVTHQ